MPKRENYVLTWNDDEQARLGEGISRSASKIAPFYQVTVTFPGRSSMKEWIRAANKGEALKFCTNRYPTATDITVIGRSNPTI
jgi:hypothetical protein